MKKWKIIILMMLVMIPIVVGEVKECKDVMPSRDIPCQLITEYQYINNCTTYTIRTYNNTPSLLDERNLTDYGDTGKCNTTFNYSIPGSYTFNLSSGDSGSIIVEESDEMASIAVIGFVTLITFSLFIIPFIIKSFSKNWILNLIIRNAIIITGLFFLTLVTTMVLTVSSTFGVGVDSEMYMFLWIIQRTAYFAMLIFVIRIIFTFVNEFKLRKYEKRMGYD